MASDNTTPEMGEIPNEYPPPTHMLRDFGVRIERDENGSRAMLPLLAEFTNDDESVRAGVLATLTDVIGGELAISTLAPDWMATTDLSVFGIARPEDGPLVATASVLKRTRNKLTIDVRMIDGRDNPIAKARLGFAVLENRGGIQATPGPFDTPLIDFGFDTAGVPAPFLGTMGIVESDHGVTMNPSPYVANTLGAVQGGAMAILLDHAAGAYGKQKLDGSEKSASVIDLSIHYLALALHGPITTRCEILRQTKDHALIEVVAHDQGKDGRIVSAATATLAIR